MDAVPGTGARLGLLLAWLAVLAVAGWALGRGLRVEEDLRRFLPTPRTPAQVLLVDELGEGPGSRALLLAVSGAPPQALAARSQALHDTLATRGEIALAANGDHGGLDAVPEHLRPYRYLLSPTLDTQPLDAAFLRDELEQRLQDLGSPAADLVEPLLPSDPTLETLRLAELWQPANAPQRRHGVWFDRAGAQALLLVQTHAAGFDSAGQQAAVAAIGAAFAAGVQDAPESADARLEISGPGAFAVAIRDRTEREMRWIGTVDTIGLLLLLGLAYRRWSMPLFGALPLASGGLAGLGAVALLFDGVHGITIAFGFTLIGVAQDYPIHFFSHLRPGQSPRASVRALWPTLVTGVIATCIAYATFLFSGVEGLKQLAVFTVAGLAVAAGSTRWLLPRLVTPARRDPADSRVLARLWHGVARLPRPRAALALLAALALAVIAFAPGAFWQNDLSRLTPVPPADLQRDAQLRAELGAPDVRYVLAVQGDDAEAALQASERLPPVLQRLSGEGVLDGYDLAARYLPSIATQRARQAQLPDTPQLRQALDEALADLPFHGDAFDPFVDDVATARAADPLTPGRLAGTPLELAVSGLLLEGEGHATALVSLTGLHDPAALAAAVAPLGAQLLDLKDASESLVAQWRVRLLAALAAAALLLAGVVWLALRSPRRVLRVLAPMALSTLLILAVLRGLGVELNLFHLVSLILAAGLGLDYALFFDHAGDDRDEQLRTLHAVIVCSLVTLLVFSLLALSSIPVLRAIGGTVALGVLFNFVLALLIARAPAAERAP
ncbi:MMPL family transporter [Pseudoxanthomonas suwonensis]|uniref:Membrane protein n=1 Tax=Pseudoxanthomonas suwonensis TaxID=314722 RepID=A0A0E3Z3B7_9GAMM|nr:MMPL family transporter [Pseudoxanthomonas suwonensis]AKC88314.1 membrane protein [Pseudoxanthomonas suwonensis]